MYRPRPEGMQFYHPLFQGMTLLPSQQANSRKWTGAEQLLIAVLVEAIQTAYKPKHIPGYSHEAMRRYGRRNLREEAWTWILSEDESYLYTFRRCCHYLGIEPGWLRRQIRRHAPSEKTTEPGRDTP